VTQASKQTSCSFKTNFISRSFTFTLNAFSRVYKNKGFGGVRIYDKAGNGYITDTALKEILRELDSKLTDEELDGIIEEIDEDGSGTVDFDEFMEMMTG